MESTTESYRLFVSIALPEVVKAEITRAQAELKQALPPNSVQWAKPEQFHLTLKFLGNVPVTRVSELITGLTGASAGFGSIPLRAERLGFFPEARRPRVIWIGVRDEAGRLSVLQGAVETAVDGFTGEQSAAKFTGHVTVGRCKFLQRPQVELLSKLALKSSDRRFGEWTAEQMELIRSELSQHGSRHTTLARIPIVCGRQS